MVEAGIRPRIAAVRHFNRFYTRQIGVLEEGLLRSPFSLTEVRIFYELAHREGLTASELGKELGLDAGYLSRMLKSFSKRKLLHKTASDSDRRQSVLSLTEKGRRVFGPLDAASHEEVRKLLSPLSSARQEQLVAAMGCIERLLGDRQDAGPSYILRNQQPGDMGWVVERHGVLYAREYAYDERFEALVAEIVAKFVQQFDPRRERCWIAERDDQNVGSVFLVNHSKSVAKLRLLLVEPSARGLGIGRRLVEECVRFARQAGYKKTILWTQSELKAARSIYEKTGFKLMKEEAHQSWGRDNLVAETWELAL